MQNQGDDTKSDVGWTAYKLSTAGEGAAPSHAASRGASRHSRAQTESDVASVDAGEEIGTPDLRDMNEAHREEMADSEEREGASVAEDDMRQVTSRDGHGGDEEAVGEWAVFKEDPVLKDEQTDQGPVQTDTQSVARVDSPPGHWTQKIDAPVLLALHRCLTASLSFLARPHASTFSFLSSLSRDAAFGDEHSARAR